MKSKFTLILSLLVVSVFFASCLGDDSGLKGPEKKIPGKYHFEKVKEFGPWSISGNDITDDYKNHSIEFYDDFSLDYTITNDDAVNVMQGTWEYSHECIGDGTEHFIDFYVMDTVANTTQYYSWYDACITRKKISASQKDADVRLAIKIVKED